MKNKFILLTDVPINRVGGLERAANIFRNWLLEESYSVVNIHRKNFIKEYKQLFLADLILIVGHRSFFIIFISIFINILKKELAWCAFWHDYKLEKNNHLIFYRIYDYFFKILYQKAKFNLVVSDYESNNISKNNSSKKIILPTFISCTEKKLNCPRRYDVFIPGRDVPHKRFKLIKNLCKELGLSYLESNMNFLSEKELVNGYLSSKYIFVPSLYESYSLVALEGMCCGCNVIVSDSVMIKDNFKKYNNFIILNRNNWNSKELREILKKLPNNTDNIQNALKIQYEFSNEFCKSKFIKQLNL